MHKRTTGLVLAAVLATGAISAVAITPASAATSPSPVASRAQSALLGVIHTHTQGAAATALGLAPAQLRTALQSGRSLADVARAQNVSVKSLVTAMVTETQPDLAAAVMAGTITQAQADTLKTVLTRRINQQAIRGFSYML